MYKNYNNNNEYNVWLRVNYDYKVVYSDGSETEDRIYSIIRNSKDVSVLSDELEVQIFDWVSLCFLSKKRSNLLRPFQEIFRGLKILEVGCGAGPITRFLGECGAEVTAIEPSFSRARIAAERCRDLSNVKIICDDLESFSPGINFDAIVQIGVLEYSTKYSDAPDAPVVFLKHLQKLLKNDGFLLTAIENQLGLKYFSGFSEDHAGVFMHNINANYLPGEATTWGRLELEGIFHRAGFTNNEFFLPFPDYKLPGMVFYPGFETKNRTAKVNMESILSNLTYQDTQQARRLFSMDKALPLVTSNGLLEQLSNSFLVLSRMEKKQFPDQEILFAQYNLSRKKEFCKEILFRYSGEQTMVDRNFLSKEHNSHVSQQVTFPATEPLLQGTLYHCGLVTLVNRPRWTIQSVGDWLKKYILILRKEINPEVYPFTLDQLLPARYIDAVPTNLVLHGDEATFIDLEVDLGEEVIFGYLLFRAIYVSISRISSFAMPESEEFTRIEPIIVALFREVGYQLDQEALDEYYIKEARLVAAVSPFNPASVKGNIDYLHIRNL
ncbi:MAG: class I SAM-dependent methyltransferase [Chitinophagaceae bacterium]